MELHANAALSWSGRRLLAERVLVDRWTLTAAAEAAGVSVRCARKWVNRYRMEGEPGLRDRSSAPRRVANRTASDRVAVIASLRQLRMTAAEIAETLSMPLSTVSAILKRQGMGRLGRIGLEQPQRYERSRAGELVHIDVKKLGRIEGGAGWRVRDRKQHYNRTYTDAAGKRRHTVGWEYVHVAVDDYSRLAYVEVLADETGATAIAFLKRAVLFSTPRRNTSRPLLEMKELRWRGSAGSTRWLSVRSCGIAGSAASRSATSAGRSIERPARSIARSVSTGVWLRRSGGGAASR